MEACLSEDPWNIEEVLTKGEVCLGWGSTQRPGWDAWMGASLAFVGMEASEVGGPQ